MTIKKWLTGAGEKDDETKPDMVFENLEARIVFDAAVQAVPDTGAQQAAQDQAQGQDDQGGSQQDHQDVQLEQGQATTGGDVHGLDIGPDLQKAADDAVAKNVDHAVLTPVGEAITLQDGTTIQKGSLDLDGDGVADGTYATASHTSGNDTVTETRFTLNVEGREINYTLVEVSTDADGDGTAERVRQDVTAADGHKVFTSEEAFDSDGHLTSADQYRYDMQGHVVTKDHTTYDADGNATGKDHADYSYDANGRMVSADELHYDENGEVTDRDHTDYHYNDKGQLVDSDHTDYDGEGNVEGKDHTDYTYDDQGRLTATDTTYFDAQGKMVAKVHSTYDADGHVISVDQTSYDAEGRTTSTEHKEFDSAGHILSADHLTYNTRGTVVVKLHAVYDMEGNIDSVNKTVYNARGVLVSVTHTTYDNNGEAITSDVTSYDALGRETGTKHIDHDAGGGEEVDTAVAAFMAASRGYNPKLHTRGQVPSIHKSPGDVINDSYIPSGSRYKYSYDRYGRITMRVVYDRYGRALDLDTWTYNSNGKIDIHRDYNVVNGKWVVKTVLNWDAYGRRQDADVYEYDSRGRCTQHTDWNFYSGGSERSKLVENFDTRGSLIRKEYWDFNSRDEMMSHEIRQLYNGRWVVWNHQGSEGSCAVLAQLSILETWKGKNYDTREIIDYCRAKGWYTDSGTSTTNMANLLKAYGMPVKEVSNASISTLQTALSQGKQIMVGIDSGELYSGHRDDTVLRNGHAIVVRGFETVRGVSYVTVTNSWGSTAGVTRVRLDTFLASWNDMRNRAWICG